MSIFTSPLNPIPTLPSNFAFASSTLYLLLADIGHESFFHWGYLLTSPPPPATSTPFLAPVTGTIFHITNPTGPYTYQTYTLPLTQLPKFIPTLLFILKLCHIDTILHPALQQRLGVLGLQAQLESLQMMVPILENRGAPDHDQDEDPGEEIDPQLESPSELIPEESSPLEQPNHPEIKHSDEVSNEANPEVKHPDQDQDSDLDPEIERETETETETENKEVSSPSSDNEITCRTWIKSTLHILDEEGYISFPETISPKIVVDSIEAEAVAGAGWNKMRGTVGWERSAWVGE